MGILEKPYLLNSFLVGKGEMKLNPLKRKWFAFVLILLMLLNGSMIYTAKVNAEENHDELFIYIGDSLMKAKESEWKTVEQNLTLFEKEWNSIKKTGKSATLIDKRLDSAKSSLTDKDVKAVNQALSSLSTAFVQYDQEQNPIDKEKEKEKVKLLLPNLKDLKSTIEKENYDKAITLYRQFNSKWTSAEKIVRTESVASYGEIETYMALIRIAITEEPADQTKALSNVEKLDTAINEFLSGKSAQKVNEKHSLRDISDLLNKSQMAMGKKELGQAGDYLNKLLMIWPIVEGDVQTKDSKLYSDIETKVPTAISLINSQNGDIQKATEIVKELNSGLTLLLEQGNYTIWDAALILLREGLEALLVVATLITFLKKTGHSHQQKWIWMGVGLGLVASAILAIFINLLFSQLSAASSREYIEGITGVIAVVMMLTVGAWLHNKSNVKNWNNYINKQIGQAIAKGSLFSFAFISFLSIFREGAETIIFYAGMAAKISISSLFLGISLASVILVIIGFFIIRYSVRMPIRLFFLTATILIYCLTFKILGISIHALQIANVVSTHSLYPFPFIEIIGLYPTLETFLPQLGLLFIILLISLMMKRKEKTNQVAVPAGK